MTADLAIVGGGPAGLATAILAAERGLDAIVVERRALPLDKACGEGLMPGAVRALAAMRVEVPVSGWTPFVGVRYVDDDVVAEGRFPEGPGWGVRRTALVEGMVARADARRDAPLRVRSPRMASRRRRRRYRNRRRHHPHPPPRRR